MSPNRPADTPRLRIGTRGSPLALAQAKETRARLRLINPAFAAPDAIELVVIKTTGDVIVDRPLAEVGGKGLFTKEIDEALIDGRIDLAVHSAKDLPTWLPEPIILAAMLPREDPRDALIAGGTRAISDLPEGCVVGTSSLRRQAQLLHHRPDLSVISLRGNVATRLRKVTAGAVGATLLAMAGLKRLGAVEAAAAVAIPSEVMVPAVGQAAIALTCLDSDEAVRMILAALDDRPTHLCVRAERAMLVTLDGSCRTPIGGYATLEDGLVIRLSGLIARPDGSRLVAAQTSGPADDGERLGRALGEDLLARAGANFFA